MAQFAAKVSRWVQQTKARQTAVLRESAQRVVDVMQTSTGAGGSMPVDTGFLRASLRGVNGAVASLPAVRPDSVSVAYDASAVSLVIANAEIGEAVTFIYTANYARRVNYGFVGRDSLGREYNQSGHHFVEKAAQQWPRIVGEVSREAKALAGQ